MQDNMATRIGYEGTDEYTPVGADASAIDKDSANVAVYGSAHADIHILDWDAESKSFTAEMSAPDQLMLRLFRYPAWQVKVNGRAIEISAHSNTGQVFIPVSAGMNRVQVKFVRTWDRMAGGWISVITVICLLLWAAVTRLKIDGFSV
jgi:hypothetical protein